MYEKDVLCGEKEFWREKKFSETVLWCLSSGLSAQSFEVNVFAGDSRLTHSSVRLTAGVDAEGMRARNGC